MDRSEIIKRSCTDKKRHATETMAKMAAKRHLWSGLNRSRKGHKSQSRMWVYPCEFCDGWHVTKRLSGHACVEV